MTTSVESTVHLRFRDALTANPAGLLLVAAALWLVLRRPARVRYSLPVLWVGLALMWVFANTHMSASPTQRTGSE